jgi:hypothetical protein
MPEDKWLRRPVIDPLLIVLKSRRMIIALSALLVSLLVMAVPELEPVRNELLTLVITLALAVIGGYTIEDAARAGRERASMPPDQLREVIKDVLNGLVDELGDTAIRRREGAENQAREEQ